jgi:3'(2'), 5'-bisphosphate nucleotidase
VTPAPDIARLLPDLRLLARQASDAILPYHRLAVARAKADGSPVTDADQAAEALILAGLKRLTPEIPVVAEEEVAAGRVPDISGGRFWLVDPLDGTREFIKGNGEFTVNIGLIEEGRPVLGVIHIPTQRRGYAGMVAERFVVAADEDGPDRPIAARPVPPRDLVVVASRSHRTPELEAYIARLPAKSSASAGSSLKFCLVAEGRADVYPRLGRTMEWDTAAGHAIVEAAGGRVQLLDGGPLVYGKAGFENPNFVVEGRAA